MIYGYDFYLKENNILSMRIKNSLLDNFAFHNLIDTLDLLQTALFDNLTKEELEKDLYFVIYYSNTAKKINVTIDEQGYYYFRIDNNLIMQRYFDEYISLNFN